MVLIDIFQRCKGYNLKVAAHHEHEYTIFL